MRGAITIAGLILLLTATRGLAINSMLGEVQIEAASRVERDAGVWLDEQYIGYVKNLRGSGKLVLVPGEHRLVFKLIGYEDLTSSIVVEPGARTRYRVSMSEASDVEYPERSETAKLRLAVKPVEAAIFVDDAYVGHVNRFNGRNGMRLSAGTYRFTIALPGYQAFETELTLHAGQTYQIKTDLPKESLDAQADVLTAREAEPTAP